MSIRRSPRLPRCPTLLDAYPFPHHRRAGAGVLAAASGWLRFLAACSRSSQSSTSCSRRRSSALILMHSGRDAGLRRHGLHADLAGRNAHRRAQPDAADRASWRCCSSRTRSCCTACSRKPGSWLLRGAPPRHVRVQRRAGDDATSTATSSASRWSRRRSTSTTRTATTSTSATRPASPGTLLTFFEWPRAEPRPARPRDARVDRARDARPSTQSARSRIPTGCALRLYPGDRPRAPRRGRDRQPRPLRRARRRGGAALASRRRSRSRRSSAPASPTTSPGAPSDDAEQEAWRERLFELGLRPTALQERKYFRSIYFRMPDGILLEIATDGPGFLVDEPPRRSATGARAAAVARARAGDARARARPHRLTAARLPPASTRWWRNW